MTIQPYPVCVLPMMQQEQAGTFELCVSGELVYEACRSKVEKVLYGKVVKASEAANMEFYAFSYYYDRAVDLGAIGTRLMLMLM